MSLEDCTTQQCPCLLQIAQGNPCSHQRMLSGRTDSIQTVCQMPELAVYQMPPGATMRCFPTGMWADSVGSHTRTMSSCVPVVLMASAEVMSYENLSYLHVQHLSVLEYSCYSVNFYALRFLCAKRKHHTALCDTETQVDGCMQDR